MARIESLSLLTTDDAKLYLTELYGNVIANVMRSLTSARMKNKDLSGDPRSGSVVAKRFANATPKDYGTARAAGNGEKIKAEEVVVMIDDDKEFVEEIEEKDIKLGGVDGLMSHRSSNHVLRMAAYLDTKFYKCAADNATKIEVDLAAGAVEEVLESCIQEVENTKNAFVDGVPRQMIHMVLNSTWYGKIRNSLDKQVRSNVDTGDEEFYVWHGVEVVSSINLPAGCPFILMVDGAVAQPVMSDQYTAEKIPLSNAWAISLFYHNGTSVVTPDLIFVPVQTGAEKGSAAKYRNVQTGNILHVSNALTKKLVSKSTQYTTVA